MEDYQKLASHFEKQIKDWQEQVAKLQGMNPGAGGDMKAKFDEGVQTLTKNMSEAQSKLAELQGTNAQAWSELEKSGRKAFEEWQKGWEKAMSKYKW